MQMGEIIRRAAARAGVGEGDAGRVVDAFLDELRAAVAAGRPGAFSDIEGYDQGAAPRDS